MFFHRRSFTLIFCLFFVLLFAIGTPALSQTLPWSWTISGPFPNLYINSFYLWPQSGYFPSAGPVTSSGWPIYSIPPNYSPAPGGVPTSATGCPVGLINGLTLDEEFGAGTSQITRCLVFRTNVKMVMQINTFESRPGRPYGLHNLIPILDDYEITNGTRDVEIVCINHSGGATQLLNRNAPNLHPNAALNVYQELVESLMVRGVQFYLCMNSARSAGIKSFHLIPGVRFVTSALTALVDFQKMDYKLIKP